ncbi:hypothetical protein GWA97_00005 [Flavobacterium sp. LaA7.5]|nr:hypothetical protein [Flavobacterium salilacus subsp. altitudinum]
MKKITTILMMFIALSSFAQLKVSDTEYIDEVGKVGPFGLPYNARITKSNGVCKFEYKDSNYQTTDVYKSFTFKESDLDALYDMFRNNINAEDGVDKTIELEDESVLFISYRKTMGKVYAYVEHKDIYGTRKLPWLNYKQVDKLFGKKNK